MLFLLGSSPLYSALSLLFLFFPFFLSSAFSFQPSLLVIFLQIDLFRIVTAVNLPSTFLLACLLFSCLSLLFPLSASRAKIAATTASSSASSSSRLFAFFIYCFFFILCVFLFLFFVRLYSLLPFSSSFFPSLCAVRHVLRLLRLQLHLLRPLPPPPLPLLRHHRHYHS